MKWAIYGGVAVAGFLLGVFTLQYMPDAICSAAGFATPTAPAAT